MVMNIKTSQDSIASTHETFSGRKGSFNSKQPLQEIMTVFVALLRGINVGGHKRIRMADLVQLCTFLGFGNVRTYLQSGNVLFESPYGDPGRLSAMISKNISAKFGFTVNVILRTSDELRRIILANPFAKEGLDADKYHVTFLSGIPSEEFPGSRMKGKDGPDRYVIMGREIYLFCPDGYGMTKFSTPFFEKKLGVVATTRNFKTVNTLAELAERQHDQAA
jgi:uncharacterized protein (DUF1697 family)